MVSAAFCSGLALAPMTFTLVYEELPRERSLERRSPDGGTYMLHRLGFGTGLLSAQA